MQNPYFKLLKEYCDRLLTFQLKLDDPAFFGGLICPACGLIHGRIGDAVYPMLTVAEVTGDSRYITAARDLFYWTEKNMKQCDKTVANDFGNDWRGITVFSAISLAEALHYHGHLLDDQTRRDFEIRLREETDAVSRYLPIIDPAVNYIAALPALLALCHTVLHDESYAEKARLFMNDVYDRLTESKFFFGEGHPTKAVSEKGCRSVDIGYNFEESIPSVALYARLMKDEKAWGLGREMLWRHLDFILPDGGLDNSFGARMAKWTYWGSRTSDGALTALALYADEAPEFQEAAARCFSILKDCSKDGLLYGGPQYAETGQRPCLHHTFCHAKELAFLVDEHFEPQPARCQLPADRDGFYRFYPELSVALTRVGNWRASISGYDYPLPINNYSTGGAMTLLYHDLYGVIFSASMPRYVIVEPNNMQYPTDRDFMCATPRIEKEIDGRVFTNIYDRAVSLEISDHQNYHAVGYLRSEGGEKGPKYEIEYRLTPQAVTVIFVCSEEATVILPIAAPTKSEVEMLSSSIKFFGKSGTLKLCANAPFEVLKRNFNPVGGFETRPVKLSLKAEKELKVVLGVQ